MLILYQCTFFKNNDGKTLFSGKILIRVEATCQCVQSFFFRPMVVARMMLWNRVYPSSVYPSFSHSLGIRSLVFVNVCMVLKTHMKLCMTTTFKKNSPKNVEMDQKCIEKFNLLKNIVISFFWIWFVINVNIICYIPAQILYLEKSTYWGIGQNALGQSEFRSFKSTTRFFLKALCFFGWASICLAKSLTWAWNMLMVCLFLTKNH